MPLSTLSHSPLQSKQQSTRDTYKPIPLADPWNHEIPLRKGWAAWVQLMTHYEGALQQGFAPASEAKNARPLKPTSSPHGSGLVLFTLLTPALPPTLSHHSPT